MVGSEPDMAGQRDLRRIASYRAAMLVQHIPLPGEYVRRTADEVPVLRVQGGRAQCPALPVAAYANRRMRPLWPLWLAPCILQLVESAVKIGRLVRQQADEHLARFLEPVAALA